MEDRLEFARLLELLTERLDKLESYTEELYASKLSPFVDWLKMPKYSLHAALKDTTFRDVGLIPALRIEEGIGAE